MFQVLQNQKPCSSFKIKGWTIDTFNTHRGAEVFAYLWAYPVTLEEAEINAPAMKLQRQYDYSSFVDGNVLMSIVEV
jgi:hypothetical protein